MLASYHLSAQPVKRSEGRSVVAMAAYRAGAKLQDERRGSIADYSRKRGVVHAEVLVPEDGAAFLKDRERLWNYVESLEKRKDAQLAREINVALPHELNAAQRLHLVREFVKAQFVARGMVADLALHEPVPEKGDDPRNFHAHILLTLRQAGAEGLRHVKTREWNSDEMLIAWRAAWASAQNHALDAAGHRVRVDHRSLVTRKTEAKVRGDMPAALKLDRTPEIHVGPKARKAGGAGKVTSRDKEIGPVRGGGRKRRVRRYSEFDKGSRGEANIFLLSANAGRARVHLTALERRLVRLRKRARYYNLQYEAYQAMRRLGEQVRWSVWKDPFALENSFAAGELQRRIEHVEKRNRQVDWLIEYLEIAFLVLLESRESQLQRRKVWSNRLSRWRPLDVESDGRSRGLRRDD